MARGKKKGGYFRVRYRNWFKLMVWSRKIYASNEEDAEDLFKMDHPQAEPLEVRWVEGPDHETQDSLL